MTKKIFLFFIITFCSQSFADTNNKLSCFGTEPFFSIQINQFDILQYSSPGFVVTKIFESIEKKNAIGTSGDFAYQIKATNENNESLKLNIIKATCNDGMSDANYPYSLLLEDQGNILYGCCE